jgi:hypothetical protein
MRCWSGAVPPAENTPEKDEDDGSMEEDKRTLANGLLLFTNGETSEEEEEEDGIVRVPLNKRREFRVTLSARSNVDGSGEVCDRPSISSS